LNVLFKMSKWHYNLSQNQRYARAQMVE